MTSKKSVPITAMGCTNSVPSSRPRIPDPKRREEVLLRIPSASVHLAGDSEVVELARGDFSIVRITDEDIPLATVVKVGPQLQWPLTKDEPVIKIDKLHYLFTLPDKDGSFLNYGVTFAENDGLLDSLDQFLKEHACFSTSDKPSGSKKGSGSYEVYWRDYAPNIDEYNGALAKAIAQGTGQILRGIFTCTNAYTTQVQKAAGVIQQPTTGNNSNGESRNDRKDEASKSNGRINKSLHRVRNLSEMTEKMSKSVLNGVLLLSGTVTAPIVRSKAGKAFFSMLPGEVLLASLGAVGTLLDACEVAERRAFAATSDAVSGAVSKKFGESAGEATGDALATAGHAIGTAWNVLQIRQAINPKKSVKSAIVRNALNNKKS